jgi:hypothetical protein
MTFSPALSLGVASLCEVLDVKLTVDVDPAELAHALTKASPEGLEWRGGAPLGADDRGVSKVIDTARYAVGIPRRALDALGGEARLREEVARVLASTDVKVIRRFERGLAKSVDVKRFLRAISPLDERGARSLDEARVLGDLVPLLVDTSISGEGSVKIAEVMEALFPSEIPFHAVRAELGMRGEDGAILSPLELQRLRQATENQADSTVTRCVS